MSVYKSVLQLQKAFIGLIQKHRRLRICLFKMLFDYSDLLAIKSCED